MSNESNNSSVTPAAKWHAEIAFEMREPMLPENAPPELIQEIANQRERHETFAKVLKRIGNAKPA